MGLAIEPRLVTELAGGLGRGSIVVSGTNGKTTTASIVAAAARKAGLTAVANASGSNLMRGIASALAQRAGVMGEMPDGTDTIGVFEVDEAALPQALRDLQPRVAVITNLFRDQLDRYGEVEAVADLWRGALAGAPSTLTLVLNADDPTVASLGEGRERVLYFGLDDPALDRGCLEHASDALTCGCGARYAYDRVYFGHIGVWRCPACGRARPRPAVRAEAVDLRDGRSLRFRLQTPRRDAEVELQVGGAYNVYNALAAVAAAEALALPEAAAAAALSAATAAFGRQEAFEIDGRRVELFLGKNPAGLNQVLATLRLDPLRRSALVILNDGIADGRDISWVWDADFEVAAGQFEAVVVAGTRAHEMALRLKYAEWDERRLAVEPDIGRALDAALQRTQAGACLSIIPTYTAMLEVRELLARRAGRAPFWQ